jgi:hypothetical protein
MEPDRLVKVAVGLGTLGAWKARIPDAFAILCPGGTSTGCRVLNVGNHFSELSSRLDVEQVQVAVLAAIARE